MSVTLSQEEQKKKEYGQVLALWRWLKEQHTPQNETEWAELVKSAQLIDSNDQPLLRQLLIAGIDYYQDLWREEQHGNG